MRERKLEGELTEAERWYWIGFDEAIKGRRPDDATLYRCPFALEYSQGHSDGREINRDGLPPRTA